MKFASRAAATPRSAGGAAKRWQPLLLILKGYRILGRRVRTKVGEIDLIARAPGGIVCFIEVKARGGELAALESIGARQRGRIGQAARLWLARAPGLAAQGDPL